MAAAKRRPVLSLEVPVNDASYRVDDEGTFVHGSLAVGGSGLVDGGAAASEGKQTDIKLEDIETLDVLGEGNSSVVFRVRHNPTSKLLALKRINIFDRAKRHQLVKELQTLYRADSPHLISFYGAFFKEGSISILIELMDAGSVADILKAVKSFTEPQMAWLAKQILAGLAYMGQRRQVHRDIKPSNICMNTLGEVKLTDFGIVSQLESTLQVCDTFVGTSAYMSPERILGEAYSFPSDIWSFGIVLLECAIGKYPYPDMNAYLELMSAVVTGPVPEAPADKFTPEFRDFISSCLQKDPTKRKSAEQLLLHPFLTKDYKTTKDEMASFVQAAVKLGKELEAKAAASGTPLSKGGKTTTTTAAAGGRAPLSTHHQTTTTTTPGTPATPLAPGNTLDGRVFAGQLHGTNTPPSKR